MPATVPRLIHQMWGDREIPEPYASYHRRIRDLNPGCQMVLWTDASIAEFVEARFPERLEAFRALPLDVHRWDLFRYMALHEHGGLYVDMDIEPSRPFTPLFQGGELSLFREHPQDVLRLRRASILTNAVICCAPASPLMAGLIETICSLQAIDASRSGVCAQTGPVMLTSLFERLRPAAAVHDHQAFFPNPVPMNGVPGNRVGYFGTHRFASSWWGQVSNR